MMEGQLRRVLKHYDIHERSEVIRWAKTVSVLIACLIVIFLYLVVQLGLLAVVGKIIIVAALFALLSGLVYVFVFGNL